MAEKLVEIQPSRFRRAFGVGVLGLLGLLLLYLGLGRSHSSGLAQLSLSLMGALSLFGAQRMWRATSLALILTSESLVDGAGREIAQVDNIERVDRGMFAMKPSNGFNMRLSEPRPRAWAPGLWWRMGRRVGVGGTLSGGQSRLMADTLTALVNEHKGASAP